MIRKILVYEDALADKHPALERALQLARHDQMAIKVVDVVDGPLDELRELHRPLRNLVEQERKDRLGSLCEPLRVQKIEFTTELIRGRPFVEIVREVVHEGFQLVIKTMSLTKPNEVMGRMGPVDMRLVRNCPCPIWLESPSGPVRCQRVLVAAAPQSNDEELNIALLELGVSLTKNTGGELHVVGAWEVPDEEFLLAKMDPRKFSRFVADVQSLAEQNLEAMLVRAGKPVGREEVHFRKGDPVSTILDCLESLQPDVLVMGTVSRTDIRGLLIGNTADAVLRRVNCSVLAVKPDGLFRA